MIPTSSHVWAPVLMGSIFSSLSPHLTETEQFYAFVWPHILLMCTWLLDLHFLSWCCSWIPGCLFTHKTLRHLKFEVLLGQINTFCLSFLQNSLLSSLIHFHGALQHLPPAQAHNLRVILDLILSKSTNIFIFWTHPICFIRTSHISLLLPTSPLNSAMVLISSNWPPIILLGAELLKDAFRNLSLTFGTDLPCCLPTCLASSRPLLCLFMPQQVGSVWTSQCHCFYFWVALHVPPPPSFLEHLISLTKKPWCYLCFLSAQHLWCLLNIFNCSWKHQ